MHCNKYLVEEIGQYQPDLLLTFGEPTHKLFCTIIKDTPSSDFNERGHLMTISAYSRNSVADLRMAKVMIA
jgi:hypothetical protein